MKMTQALRVSFYLFFACSLDAAQRDSENQPYDLREAMLQEAEERQPQDPIMTRPFLHAAAAHNHAVVIELLHRIGADMNARDADGLMAIHHAVANDAVAAVQVLLTAGADTLLPFPDGTTLLFFAMRNEGLLALRCLLDALGQNALMQTNRDGDRLLHAATTAPNPGALVMLLARGTPVDVLNRFGRTSLHLAVLAQNIEAIRILRVFGARPDHGDFMGRTPLALARVTRNPLVIAALTTELDRFTVLAPYAALMIADALRSLPSGMPIDEMTMKRHRDDQEDPDEDNGGKFRRSTPVPPQRALMWATPSHLN